MKIKYWDWFLKSPENFFYALLYCSNIKYFGKEMEKGLWNMSLVGKVGKNINKLNDAFTAEWSIFCL